MANLLVRTIDCYDLRGKVSTFLHVMSHALILDQLRWFTSNNAANNDTCMQEFARIINAKKEDNVKEWDFEEGRIRCDIIQCFHYFTNHYQ